jgi:mono/diheme cytochrome c family protein
MMTKLAIATAALVATFAVPALVDEDSFELEPGVGAEVVEQNCATCHSRAGKPK